MPHVIAEISSNIAAKVDVEKLMKDMFEAMVETKVVPAKVIKVRCIKTDSFYIGEKGLEGSMAHLQIGIIGKDTDVHNMLIDKVYPVMVDTIKPEFPDCLFSAEVRGFDEKVYRKSNVN